MDDRHFIGIETKTRLMILQRIHHDEVEIFSLHFLYGVFLFIVAGHRQGQVPGLQPPRKPDLKWKPGSSQQQGSEESAL